jgi:flagellar basal body-associated protein FliL
MAIVIEEEKNKINILSIITWLVIIVIIGLAVYYIFFSQPQLIEVATPSSFQNINPLAKINISPENVINGPAFQSLKSTITLPAPGNAGRGNPFLMP